MAATLDRENMRQLLAIKTKLGSNVRHYIINKNIVENTSCSYHYAPSDIRLLRFANGAMGSISDCFILYAVAKLGVCDKESVCMFLKALHKTSPHLSIPNYDDMDSIRRRLNALFKNGLFFKQSYGVDVFSAKTGLLVEDIVSLYTIDKDAHTFMNQKLGKKVTVNTWIQAKPVHELIGWAAATYVGVHIANTPGFCEYKEGIFRSRSLGTVMLPCELKMNSGKYVMCIPSFLWHDTRIANESEYVDSCLLKINTILNYLNYRTNANKTSRVVVVVQDSNDLDFFTELVINSEVLQPYLSEIYFTGEGIVKSDGVGTMLQMKISAEGQPDFRVVSPDFL